MLNAVKHQGNANQNHNKIPLYTTRIAIIKKRDNNNCWWGYRNTGTIRHHWCNIKWFSHLGNSWQFWNMLNVEVACDPEIPLPGTHWRKWKYIATQNMNVYSNITYNGQNWKWSKCLSTNEWIKQKVLLAFIQRLIFFISLSVQFSPSVVSDSLQPHELQHARPPCPSPTPGLHSNSCSSSWWCHPAISSSVIPFSSCPQSLPASESFPMSQLFAWGSQSTEVLALASFLPKKSQGWSSSEWTGWTSLQSKGLSRVLSNTTVQKHQFFGTQLSSQSNSHIHTWLLEKP